MLQKVKQVGKSSWRSGVYVVLVLTSTSCDPSTVKEKNDVQIKTVDYFEKYNPPNTYWDWHSGRIERNESHDLLVKQCIQDFKKVYERELELWKVYERKDSLFFVFQVVEMNDSVVVYEYDKTDNLFVERFFIPMT